MADFNVDIKVTESGARQAGQNISGIGAASTEANAGVQALNSGLGQLKGLLVAAGLALSVKGILDTADAYQVMLQKIQNNSSSMADFIDKEQRIYDIALKTRVALAEVSSTYVSMEKATRALGLAQSDTASLTETVSKALTVSNKTGDEAAGAMKRLGLALQSGQTNGRLFQTMFLQFPELGKALAEGLGKPIPVLKDLMLHSQLTSREIVAGLIKGGEAGSELARKFEGTQITLAQGWTNMSTAIMRYFGQADQGWGVTKLIATSLDFVAQNIDVVIPAVKALTVAMTIFGAATLGTAFSFTALWTAIGANRWAIIYSLIAGVVSLVVSFAEKIQVPFLTGVNLAGLFSVALTALTSALSAVYTWVTTTTVGTYAFVAVMVSAAIPALVSFGGVILGMVLGALGSLVAMILRVGSAMLTMLLNPVGLTIAAFVAGAVAVAYYTGTLDALVKKTAEVGQTLTGSITKALQDASRAAEKNGLETTRVGVEWKKLGKDVSEGAGDAGGAAKKMAADTASALGQASVSMDLYWHEVERAQQNSKSFLSAMGQDVLAASVVINKAWGFAANDPDAGLKAYQQRLYETQQAADATMTALIQQSKRLADETKRNMGDTGRATQEMADTSDSSLKGLEGSYDSWASTAERDSSRVVTAMRSAEDSSSSMTRFAKNDPKTYGGSYSFDLTTPYAQEQQARQGENDALALQIDLLQAQVAATGVANSQIEGMQKQLAVNQARLKLDIYNFNSGIWAGIGSSSIEDQFATFKSGFKGPTGNAWKPGQGAAMGGFFGNYASGGSFMVGGTGGTDSQLVSFMASPDERVDISTPGDRKNNVDNRQNNIRVTMNVRTPDANSFKRSEPQAIIALTGKLARAQQVLAGR